MPAIYRVTYRGIGSAKGEYREVLLVAANKEEARGIADQRLAENHPVPRDDAHAAQLALEAFGSAGNAEPTKAEIQARARLFYETPQTTYRFASLEKAGPA